MGYRTLSGVPAIIFLISGWTGVFSMSQTGTSPDPAQASRGAAIAALQQSVQTAKLPAPISVANIASEVGGANVKLRRMKLDLDVAVKLPTVERELAVVKALLQRIQPVLESGNTPPEEELFDFRQELTRSNLRLKQLQDELIPRSRVLEGHREELGRMERLWKATHLSLSLQEAPSSSKDLVLSTQRRIDELGAVIRAYRPVLLTIQDGISEQRITADELLARTNDAIDRLRRQLFTMDSEPLWRAGRSGEAGSSAELIRRLYSSRVLPLFDYMKDNKRLFYLHLLLALFLVWLLAAISRGSWKWLGPAGENRGSGKVLRHPLAAALVISLLLSFSIYPNPPLTLYMLPFLLMMFPLVRIVSPAISREERAIFFSLTGLYILCRLNGLFSSVELVVRISLLIITCLGIFLALWGESVQRAVSQAGIGPWRTARLQLLRFAAVILAGSVIANVVGNVTLAVLLTNACISSAYAGAALFAGVLVLEAFILPLFDSPLAQLSLTVRERSAQFRRHAALLIRFGALAAWVWSTLLVFGVSYPIFEWLSSMLATQHSFGRMAFSLGGILLFVVTICISFWLAWFAAFVAEKDILSRMKLPQGIPATVSMLVRDIIIALGFILALAGAGVQWSQIALVAGAIGVGIGFGLQQLVASFIAGLILIFERPIRIGDTIEIGKMEGVVSHIGLRSSTIRVVDGSELICPNSRLISEDLINWTLSNQIRRTEVQVGIPHGADPDVVLAVLKKVAGDHPLVLSHPEPHPLFKGFGESSLMFALRFFTLQGSWVNVSSDICIRINNALREKGIHIALPRRDIRITGETAPAQTIPTKSGTGFHGSSQIQIHQEEKI